MRIGALLGPVVAGAKPKLLVEQVKQYEAAGFQSLWTGQAIGRGFMMADPFEMLTVAATLTDNLEIGSAVLQVPLYQPVELAHRALSLQQLCGDRLTLGVGVGSTEADFLTLGLEFQDRFKMYRQSMKIVREIFETGRSGDSDLTPWPEVMGGPRLYLGSWGAGVERAARDYDGWIASGHFRSPEQLDEGIRRYRAAGGDRAIVSTIRVSGESDLGELGARLDQYAESGFDDAVVFREPGALSPESIVKLVDG